MLAVRAQATSVHPGKSKLLKAQPLSGTQVLRDLDLTHIPKEKEELLLMSVSGCWALTLYPLSLIISTQQGLFPHLLLGSSGILGSENHWCPAGRDKTGV